MRGFGTILIGFNYDKIMGKVLPGTTVDLYRSYIFFKDVTNINNFKVLTDVENDPDTGLLMNSILDGIVDSKVINFITNMKTMGMHSYIDNLDSLLNSLKEFITFNKLKFLTVYYTGHGINNQIILPSNEKIDIFMLEKLIYDIVPGVEIFFVIDCCSMKLSDQLINCKINKYESNFREYTYDNRRCIYLVSSDSTEEKSISTNIGSLFTRVIFETLTYKIRNFQNLYLNFENINIKYNTFDHNNINLSIYSTVTDKQMWEWIYGERERIISNENSVIILNLNDLMFDTYNYHLP